MSPHTRSCAIITYSKKMSTAGSMTMLKICTEIIRCKASAQWTMRAHGSSYKVWAACARDTVIYCPLILAMRSSSLQAEHSTHMLMDRACIAVVGFFSFLSSCLLTSWKLLMFPRCVRGQKREDVAMETLHRCYGCRHTLSLNVQSRPTNCSLAKLNNNLMEI